MALPRIARRRMWLILAVAVVITAAAGLGLRPGKLAYESQVRVQLTTPQQEDIQLLNVYRSSNVRDEATLARNNFLVVLKSPEVQQRTVAGLRLSAEEATYEIKAQTLRDTDFIDVGVRAVAPELAQDIANTHVAEAIRRYGELRALPAGATRSVLAQALQNAAERSQAAGSAVDVTGEGVREAREAYQLLLKKYTEATLAEENAQKATYIQVIEAAAPALHVASSSKFLTLVGLAAVGGLGLGLALAVLLESRREPPRRARVTVGGWSGRRDSMLDDEGYPIVVPEQRRHALGAAEMAPVESVDDEPMPQPAAVLLPADATPEQLHRERVRRSLRVARHLLRQAERRLSPEEQERVGEAVRMMRAIVFDAWKGLRAETPTEQVVRGLRTGVEGVTQLLALVDGSNWRRAGGPDLEALVAEALDDNDALTLLIERASAPAAAVWAVQALAASAAEPPAADGADAARIVWIPGRMRSTGRARSSAQAEWRPAA